MSTIAMKRHFTSYSPEQLNDVEYDLCWWSIWDPNFHVFSSGIQLRNRILTVQYSVLCENLIAVIPFSSVLVTWIFICLSIASGSAALVAEGQFER